MRLLRSIKYEVLSFSGFYSLNKFKFGFYRCSDSLCTVCNKSLPSTFAFDNNYKQYRILSFINCNTSFVIYSVYCKKCGPISIKFSQGTLQTAIKQLLYLFHLCKFTNPIIFHFTLPDHTFKDFYFQGLQSFSFSSRQPFKDIEKWIKRLRTNIHPAGIDAQFCYSKPHFITIPFSSHNNNILNRIKFICKKRFNCNIISSFSSYPNLKHILCKSKI